MSNRPLGCTLPNLNGQEVIVDTCGFAAESLLEMEKETHYREGEYPPSNYLAAAIRNLPTPAANIPPQTVDIDTGPSGRYRVTFVVRQNISRQTPLWYWGVESGQRVPNGGVGIGELQDPD